MFYDAIRPRSVAACAQLPPRSEPERRDARAPRRRHSRWADVLTVGAGSALEDYFAGLFERSGWTVSGVSGCVAASQFLRDAGAAVVVCEERLPDGCWRDVAFRLNAVPDMPNWIVVGDGEDLPGAVLARGGFDTLTRPLWDCEVLWSVASAWHEWMKREEARRGGSRCSGG
jgi:hypothetical protein